MERFLRIRRKRNVVSKTVKKNGHYIKCEILQAPDKKLKLYENKVKVS